MEQMENIHDIVRHFLKVDQKTRSNDLYLTMRVLERRGYARHLSNTRYGSGYFIRDKDIIGGHIPHGTIESIRRCRQLIQASAEGKYLRPEPEVVNARLDMMDITKKNINKMEVF